MCVPRMCQDQDLTTLINNLLRGNPDLRFYWEVLAGFHLTNIVNLHLKNALN